MEATLLLPDCKRCIISDTSFNKLESHKVSFLKRAKDMKLYLQSPSPQYKLSTGTHRCQKLIPNSTFNSISAWDGRNAMFMNDHHSRSQKYMHSLKQSLLMLHG